VLDFGLGGRLAGEATHLALHELPIEPVAPNQEIGRAVLHNLAELQHDDAVEIPDRRKAMRNGDHGTSSRTCRPACAPSSANAASSSPAGSASGASRPNAYLGFMFSQNNGGLVNGYLAHNNLATTMGVRFRF